jgi:hypothetical protein
MSELAPVLGRKYQPFEYVGSSKATHVIVAAGEAATIAADVLAHLGVCLTSFFSLYRLYFLSLRKVPTFGFLPISSC